VQFSRAGHPARLVLGSYKPRLDDWRCSALVLDSDSRYFSGDKAYKAVRATAEELRLRGARRFFKKIDSTLRGNIAAEIAAVMDGAGYSAAIVCPAAPRNGRTVVDGLCLVEGRPVGSQACTRDRFTPVGEARVSSHFDGRFPGAVAALPLSIVRSGNESLAREVAEKRARGARIFVADAETLEDLRSIAGLSSMPGLLLAGSSGLAEALSEGKALARRHAGRAVARVRRGEALFIVGSLTPTSAAQCERLTGSGAAATIILDSERALADPERELERILALVRASSPDRAILLRTDSLLPRLSEEEVLERGAAISKFIGRAAYSISASRRFRFVFASGGDTAARVAQALGARRIDFTEELLPGLPCGRFKSPALKRKLRFASKSGGFGTPEALIAVLAQVARARVDDIEERKA
jgi:uncharacterized protein YgbK (DUF1537 family)